MGLLGLVHGYERKIDLLKPQIERDPNGWEKSQVDVDQIIRSVFELCLQFERDNADDEDKIYKMKKLFIRQFRPYFRLGKYNRWVMDKPYGYVGDFLIIDEIYRNQAETVGVERCLDNYFLKTEASAATRNRKENFKGYLMELIKGKPNGKIRVMDLAAGPCRDIKELFHDPNGFHASVLVDCIDHDSQAIEYGKNLIRGLANEENINFIQKNAARLALTKNIESMIPWHYDVIFSTGLFDYLDERVVVPLVRNLRKLLNKDGLMIISNYRDRWSNPSRHYMEWGGDWDLIYRTEDEFLGIFTQAGFSKGQLSLKFEPQKIMQYCFVRN